MSSAARSTPSSMQPLLDALRAKADAARAEFTGLTESSYPKPDWAERIPTWIEEVDTFRSSDPTKYSAYVAYKECLATYLGDGIIARL